MKPKTKYGVAASGFLAAMLPFQLAAQTKYVEKDLGTLGGTFSGANGVNNRGWVFGFATPPGDQEEHAVVWRNGVISDLGTLGGPSSFTGFPVKNDQGLIVGVSQTSATDPLGENFDGPLTCTGGGALCQGGDLISLGFLWQNGVITALPTLGGNNGAATGINNMGQVVGFAENNIRDPNCIPPQVLDFEAVIWGPNQGEIQELPPFPGDSISAAFAINDSGQVVGGSGFCGPPGSPAVFSHAVLWRNGSVIDLGSLGGAIFNTAFAINDGGQVVGVSGLPGDTTAHAFLWHEGVMTDLGTLSGDFSFVSVASAINHEGQVIGKSCDVNFNCHSFLWQEGVMTDLNTLIPPDSSLALTNASDINDRGEIADYGFDQSTGEVHAVLVSPCYESECGAASPAAQVGGNPNPKVVLPVNVREMPRQRLGHW